MTTSRERIDHAADINGWTAIQNTPTYTTYKRHDVTIDVFWTPKDTIYEVWWKATHAAIQQIFGGAPTVLRFLR